MKIKIDKILFVLLCLIIFFSVLSCEKYIHNNMYTIMQCIIIAVIILFFIIFYKLNSEIKEVMNYNMKKNWYIVALFLLMIVSSCVTGVYGSYLKGILYTIMFFLIMIVLGFVVPTFLHVFNKYNEMFIKYIVFFSTILSTIAIYIYYVGNIYRYSLVYGRAASILFDPNFFATFISVGVIGAFCIKNKLYRNSVIIINIFAIILSGSRGALLSLAISLIVFFIIKEKKISFKMILIISSMAIIIYIGMGYLENIGFFREHQGTNGRFEMIEYFVEKIQDKPIFGYGYSSAKSLLEENNFKNASSHNSLIDYVIGYGIPCGALFIYVLLKSINKGLKKESKITFVINILLIVNSNTILYNIGGVGMCSTLWTIFLGLNIFEEKNERNNN